MTVGALDPADRRVAVVTGAAGAIGFAIAHALAEQGHAVALADRDPAIAARAADLAGTSRHGVRGHVIDVTDIAALPALFDRVEAELGPVTALVNCAGIAATAALLDLDRAEWERILAVNLTAPLLWMQEAGRRMARRRQGRIVNIASISGLRAGIGRTAYGTSKAALIHLTRQGALELGPLGITVNAIAPGPVASALAQAVHPPETVANYLAMIPQGRYGEAAEIAALAAFLCGEGASYLNGQIIAVDGGLTAAGLGVSAAQRAARDHETGRQQST
jgi:NAD(P)-dependent dehydrogenase (short-subunit alcohol dehydrogenase family)